MQSNMKTSAAEERSPIELSGVEANRVGTELHLTARGHVIRQVTKATTEALTIASTLLTQASGTSNWHYVLRGHAWLIGTSNT